MRRFAQSGSFALALLSAVAVLALALLAAGVWAPSLIVFPPEARAVFRARDVARLAGAKDEYDRWCALPRAALANAVDGDRAAAESQAQEVLAMAPKYAKDWNYGNALHYGNLALGHLALQHGDRRAAVARLLAAGDTPGSPQLDSFGPRMSLARELLLAGERDAVLDYIDRTLRFWSMSWGTGTVWKIAIRLGFTPGFGSHTGS
jgi:hypothetical protein